jgi:hypothetical protein
MRAVLVGTGVDVRVSLGKLVLASVAARPMVIKSWLVSTNAVVVRKTASWVDKLGSEFETQAVASKVSSVIKKIRRNLGIMFSNRRQGH